MEIESSKIQKIYDSNGNHVKGWKKFLYEINLENTKINDEIFTKINQSILDKESIDLTLDIIDFIIDNGDNCIIDLIATKNFLINIRKLLKVDAIKEIEIQKKIIFLIQKWALKFGNNIKYKIFKENYENLKLKITFPKEDYKIETYNKYIENDEIKKAMNIISEIKKKEKYYKDAINNFMSSLETQYANPFFEIEKQDDLTNSSKNKENLSISFPHININDYTTPNNMVNKDNNTKRKNSQINDIDESDEKINKNIISNLNPPNNNIKNLDNNTIIDISINQESINGISEENSKKINNKENIEIIENKDKINDNNKEFTFKKNDNSLVIYSCDKELVTYCKKENINISENTNIIKENNNNSKYNIIKEDNNKNNIYDNSINNNLNNNSNINFSLKKYF